jgi:anthranilate phosphoribosyltransferase
VTALEGGEVRTFTVRPEDAGLDACPAPALQGGDARTNAGITRRVLDGGRGPARDVVLLNAAAALLVAGRVKDLGAGVAEAGRAVDDGRAGALLGRVAEASRA